MIFPHVTVTLTFLTVTDTVILFRLELEESTTRKDDWDGGVVATSRTPIPGTSVYDNPKPEASDGEKEKTHEIWIVRNHIQTTTILCCCCCTSEVQLWISYDWHTFGSST